MPDSRKIPFVNGEYYHIFNRGIDRRPVYRYKKEYQQFLNLLQFYQFENHTIRYSKFNATQKDERLLLLKKLYEMSNRRVSIISYALMPNHFHLLLKQESDKGITKFMADISNSYTKYFNSKTKRLGPLFQGLFKSVHIETNEQLLHVARYIHLNPVVSNIIPINLLAQYKYTSHFEYLISDEFKISDDDVILSQIKSINSYTKLIEDQVGYGIQLEKIKHLIFD